jgi:hypothetical protein
MSALLSAPGPAMSNMLTRPSFGRGQINMYLVTVMTTHHKSMMRVSEGEGKGVRGRRRLHDGEDMGGSRSRPREGGTEGIGAGKGA